MEYEDLRRAVELMLFEGREDDYCDFKQCYHDNKASRLHDIICMANNLSGKDGYIIFGVEDKTMNVLGIEHDANRLNQQQFVDSRVQLQSATPAV